MFCLKSRVFFTGTRLASSLATQRPPFREIFPQKKMVSRLLFELDSRLTYNKLYPIYEKLYEGLEKDIDVEVPHGLKGKDMMVMKKVLEKVRHKTKAINKNLLALENAILDRAAEAGDNDAIALLCFEVLKDPANNTGEDVSHAKKLIKKLYQMNHPLTVKLTADLALKNNDSVTAEEYYNKFLELQDDTFLAGEVYGQLGQIHFRKPNLVEAEKCFLKAIKLCPIDFSVRSYFLLGQIYMNNDIFKARSLIESSATQGFKESFKTLGLLEMNYFENYPKAQEWFKLGMELYDLECFIGYFDCATKNGDILLAKRCYESMEKLAENNADITKIFENFCSHRKTEVETVTEFSLNPAVDSLLIARNSETGEKISKSNTWDL
ncbi:unnamed protein product [Kluyveromyces dobzhanskii CBS 2104]|uniref:WGS project CCBQ000000000 data, contig 00046 n=1 Tax=Kluyveromyces dobzhanskii CBS 2104 TaxID=1427455 RepID=A0A0A8L7B8_9SACH|nr:unnamed protein product [Kluyveromyces dobzhanskii CBS 2104]